MTEQDRIRIKKAISMQTLTVASCSDDGEVRQSVVAAVHQHHTAHKAILSVSTEGGLRATVTEDHSLFLFDSSKPISTQTSALRVGDLVAVVHGGLLMGDRVVSIADQPREDTTFDLSVPGDENFVLSNGMLAHNSYSISGVSLDIDKSSKYLSLKENFEGQHEKMLDQAKSSIKIVKGLQQPRYGIGISSALGPYSRVGVQSRRNYISGGGSWV